MKNRPLCFSPLNNISDTTIHLIFSYHILCRDAIKSFKRFEIKISRFVLHENVMLLRFYSFYSLSRWSACIFPLGLEFECFTINIGILLFSTWMYDLIDGRKWYSVHQKSWVNYFIIPWHVSNKFRYLDSPNAWDMGHGTL